MCDCQPRENTWDIQENKGTIANFFGENATVYHGMGPQESRVCSGDPYEHQLSW